MELFTIKALKRIKKNSADIANFAQQLDAHKAESASKHITESGSNANGRYIKFDDGTMICYFHEPNEYITGTPTAADSFYRQLYTWTYPAAFVTGSKVRAAGSADARVNITSSVISILCGVGASGSNISCNMNIVSNANFNRIFGLSLYAIGRWKA